MRKLKLKKDHRRDHIHLLKIRIDGPSTHRGECEVLGGNETQDLMKVYFTFDVKGAEVTHYAYLSYGAMTILDHKWVMDALIHRVFKIDRS